MPCVSSAQDRQGGELRQLGFAVGNLSGFRRLLALCRSMCRYFPDRRNLLPAFSRRCGRGHPRNAIRGLGRDLGGMCMRSAATTLVVLLAIALRGVGGQEADILPVDPALNEPCAEDAELRERHQSCPRCQRVWLRGEDLLWYIKNHDF